MKIKKNIETTQKSTLKYINLESAKTQNQSQKKNVFPILFLLSNRRLF